MPFIRFFTLPVGRSSQQSFPLWFLVKDVERLNNFNIYWHKFFANLARSRNFPGGQGLQRKTLGIITVSPNFNYNEIVLARLSMELEFVSKQ